MRSRRRLFLGLLLCFSIAKSSDAAIIAQWDFTGQPGNQVSTVGSSLIAGLTVGDLTRGSGVSLSSTTNSVNSSAWTTSSGIDPNDYYQFSLAPTAGYGVSLASVAFAERRSLTGIRTFELRSSLDSFAAAIPGTITGVPDDDLVRNQPLLLGTPFTNLTTEVTFRLYGYSAESGAGTWRLQNHTTFGGLVLDGTVVAVPEPSTIAILVLLSGTWWWRDRRRQKVNVS